MTNTKNINARYNVNTGKWAIRDNNKILKKGNGLIVYGEAIKEIEKTATKKIVEKIIY